jgi:hypothetical protein
LVHLPLHFCDFLPQLLQVLLYVLQQNLHIVFGPSLRLRPYIFFFHL